MKLLVEVELPNNCKYCGEPGYITYNKEFGKHYQRKTCARCQKLKATYGITSPEYDALLAKQNNKCALCPATESRDGRPLFVDHCHDTGRIRGLLCKNCNTGLGMLGDNLDGLLRAVEYIKG